MSSAVAELDSYLQSMLQQKPPGVSGTKITSITTLCDANVQSESVLIQKIYTHFKKAPGTHKLGVLYVVDSVTRRWVEQAKKLGQPAGSTAPDGTFAAGVNRVTELLPVLMNDIILSAPEDQKDKIKKLVDIWERSNTFPLTMLGSFKEKLSAPPKNVGSTTPVGSPPAPDFIPLNTQQSAPPAQDTSAILAALANMAKTNQTASTVTPGIPAMTNPNGVLNQHAVPQGPMSVDKAGMPSTSQGVNPFAGNLSPFGMSNGAMNPNPNNQIPNQNLFQNGVNGQQNPLAALMGQANTGAAAAPDPQLQQVQILQYLIAQGIPQDQWAPVLQALAASSGNPNALGLNANVGSGPNNWQQPNVGAAGQSWSGKTEPGSRDDGRDYGRSPPHAYRRRSRSPGWDRRREVSPPGRRGSPVYGDYSGDSPGRNRDGRGGRGGRNEYRQRSPAGGRRRRSPSPPHIKDEGLPPPGPKFIQHDPSVGQGNIKVLSRTLFVGGVTSSESHLRSLFAQYGIVQTCIVNIDKRHAFVKMINRQDAVKARDGMEQYKSGEMQLRTRWGVGFGPRDCSDYQTGISIIPIERLTDADRKWMLTAEYGGSGGRPIETGLVVEEPDIEIGAGVSSKAISRRMATDQGGQRGPKSTRSNNDGPAHRERGGGGFGRRNDRHEGGGSGYGQDRDQSSNPNTIGVPPAVPGFGFNFGGLPMMQNFMMGGQGTNPSGT